MWRFIRFIGPRRLREATERDVTDWLRLLAAQPGSEAWRVHQANRALRILFQRIVGSEWAGRWPAGFLGEDDSGSWLGVARPVELPVRLAEADVRRRWGTELEKALRALRFLKTALTRARTEKRSGGVTHGG